MPGVIYARRPDGKGNIMELLLVAWIAAVVVAAVIGSSKGKGGTGLVLGLLLSWLGVIIIAVMQPETDRTPRDTDQPAT